MTKIIQRRPVPEHIVLSAHLHPVIHRILVARQLTDLAELDYSTKNLHPYQLLNGIETAVLLLVTALQQQQRILIVADYDADGATGCALLIKALHQMGGHFLKYIVPNRERHGYGLSREIVELARLHQPDLLITVDNGIVSIDGVAAAKQYGIRVLITDHHSPSQTLPCADAIVNPNIPGDPFPSKHLSGVGVAFYVMLALRARLRQLNWFQQLNIPEPNLADLLDLVALGTIADVVKLDYNNRILVEQGVRRMRAMQCCLGISALIKVAGRDQSRLTTSDLAFSVAPRLNAAGRMDDMSYGIACLLCENEKEAREYAVNLNFFNDERRYVEAEMQQIALNMVQQLQQQVKLPLGLCLFDETWHQGVIGILAGRIKDKFHRPVVIFTAGRPGSEELRGSARSIVGVHIKDVIEAIARQHPGLITKFGGHAMAAGLTLPRQNFDDFKHLFDFEVKKLLSENGLCDIILTDGELFPCDFNAELAENLRHLAPWGQGFLEPLFEGEFEVLEHKILKEKHLKLWIRATPTHTPIEAIYFNWGHCALPSQRIFAVYKLDVNHYRGTKSVQLLITHLESR
jgi:single-stranded-DNA-specific exonuclease